MTLLSDLRYAGRLLRRSPGFTLVAALTLALGIGGNTAMFSVINAVLFRPLPYAQPDRLVVVWGSHPGIGHEAASFPDFVDWRAQNHVFSGMAGTWLRSINLTTARGPERVIGARVSANLFSLLGVQPAIGRDFRPEEDAAGAGHVAILSDGLWRRQFGADPSVLGRTLTMNGETYAVVGVAPRGFAFPARAELWTPLALSAAANARRGDFLQVVARLAPGVDLARAQTEMRAIAARLERQYPETNTKWTVDLVPLHEQLVGDLRPALLALWAAVGFVLLIACANVANLLLSRASARSKEIAVRLALGASRAQVFRQLLTESVLLALIGGAGGLLLAAWGVPLLGSIGPAQTPGLADLHLDTTVLLFTVGAAVFTGLLFGLMPAAHAARASLQGVLKEGGRTAVRAGGSSRTSRLLIVGQVALSLVLLVSAGLMIRTLQRLAQVDPGFRTDNLLHIRLNLPPARYASDLEARSFVSRLDASVSALPGVRAAAISNAVYLESSSYSSMLIAGQPAPDPGDVHDAQIFAMSSGFHQSLGVPIVQGRDFAAQDGPDAPLVAIVNATFAKRYFPDGRVLGQRVSFDGSADQPRWRTIVGVAADVKQDSLTAAVYPEIDVPLAQDPSRTLALLVRTTADPSAIVGGVRAAVQRIDPDIPLYGVETMEGLMAASVASQRAAMYLFAIFAITALLLAAIGLYGVMAYAVSQRTQAIGIRLALGATPGDILRLVIGEGLMVTLIGIAIGVAGAVALTRYLQTLLFGVTPRDPVTYLAIAALLLITALAACYLPARRAMRLDPAVALRDE